MHGRQLHLPCCSVLRPLLTWHRPDVGQAAALLHNFLHCKTVPHWSRLCSNSNIATNPSSLPGAPLPLLLLLQLHWLWAPLVTPAGAGQVLNEELGETGELLGACGGQLREAAGWGASGSARSVLCVWMRQHKQAL